jgi:hypothetical protein
MQERGRPVLTKPRRYRIDILREMNVADLVVEYRAQRITFDDLCYHIRGRSYDTTRDELQSLRDTELLSQDDFSYLKGELLAWHLHEFF